MKKERKKQFKKIKEEKIRLESHLKNYLENQADKKGYETFVEVLDFLQCVNLQEMEMEDSTQYTEICPYFKLDSKRNLSIAIAILHTYISCKIYYSRASYKGIPDELMNEITDFDTLLATFLFS